MLISNRDLDAGAEIKVAWPVHSPVIFIRDLKLFIALFLSELRLPTVYRTGVSVDPDPIDALPMKHRVRVCMTHVPVTKNERVLVEKRDALLLFSTDPRIVSEGRASHKRT